MATEARGEDNDADHVAGWSDAGWMWDLHVWLSASLFSVLALLCLFTVLRLRSQLSRSRNLTSLNVFLGILASSRLLVLYLDPYGSKLILPAVLLQVLWDLAWPCLVSAFCLLAIESKVTGLSDSSASIAITSHFCLIITSAVLGALQKGFRVVWTVIQVVFILWGGFLFAWTLLGCVRTLRSYVKLPLRLMTQVDPGCEVKSIGMLSEPDDPPRIHITDVNEQTYTYDTLKRSDSMPDKKKKTPKRSDEDPATIKPLLVSSLPEIRVLQDRPRRNAEKEPSTIFRIEPKQSLSPSLLMPSMFGEDEQHRLESRLRHLLTSSCLGIALCLLRTYDVFGPRTDGLVGACGNTAFFLQTLARFVELIMSFSMVCGSQRQSRHHYYNRN